MVIGMGRSDRITILLSVAALCATIIGTSCSTNARIGDMNARIGDVNARIGDMNARIDDVHANVNARIDDVRAELMVQIAGVNARIDGLSEDIRELRAIVIDAVKTDASSAD